MKVNDLKLLKYIPLSLPKKVQNNFFDFGSDLRLCKPLNSDAVQLTHNCSEKFNVSDMLKKIKKSMKNPANYLGEGGEAYVYRIENTDYCIRFLRDKPKDYKNTISFNVTEEDKINHVVAKLSNNATIMRYIDGYPVYLFPNSKVKPQIKQSELDKILEDMPVAAFHKLFKQVCHAKKHDMIFDCSWNNIILNPKNKTITAIDFYKMNPEYPEIVKPLRNCYAGLTYLNSTPAHKENCAGKLILAALEELKPGVKSCLNITEFRFASFIDHIYEDSSLIPNKFVNILKSVLTEIECLKFKEIAGNDVKTELNGKHKVAKALVNQVFFKSS